MCISLRVTGLTTSWVRNFAACSKSVSSLAVYKAAVSRAVTHTGRNAVKAMEEEADNLFLEIHVCIGARVMLTANL